jgi:hypothetical protein
MTTVKKHAGKSGTEGVKNEKIRKEDINEK